MNSLSLLAALFGLATAPVDTHQTRARGQADVAEGKMDVAKATAAFYRGEYSEAARAFDRLHAERGGLALLHYAALAWATAGDDTRAILRWRRLAADPQSRGLAEAKDAADFLAEAYKRTTAVGVVLTPDWISGQVTSLSLKRLDKAEEAITITVTEASVDEHGRHVVFLAPGRWSLSADILHPGYASAPVNVDVSSQQVELEAALIFRPRMGEIAVEIEGLAGAENAVLVLKDEAGIVEPVSLSLPLPDGLAVVHAGAWTYEASSSRGELLKGRVDVSPSETTTLTLRFKAVDAHSLPPALDDAPPRQRSRLDLGLGLGALVVGGVGVGTFVSGYRVLGPGGIQSAGAACDPDGARETGERRLECVVTRSFERSRDGAGLMGSSLGLATNAVLARAQIRRQLYWVPWSSGLLMTTGGIVWLQIAHRDFLASSFLDIDSMTPDDDNTVPQAAIDQLYWRREVPASVIMGFGAGLLVGSSIALITQRLRQRPRATDRRVSIRFGGRGFSLHGKF